MLVMAGGCDADIVWKSRSCGVPIMASRPRMGAVLVPCSGRVVREAEGPGLDVDPRKAV